MFCSWQRSKVRKIMKCSFKSLVAYSPNLTFRRCCWKSKLHHRTCHFITVCCRNKRAPFQEMGLNIDIDFFLRVLPGNEKFFFSFLNLNCRQSAVRCLKCGAVAWNAWAQTHWMHNVGTDFARALLRRSAVSRVHCIESSSSSLVRR